MKSTLYIGLAAAALTLTSCNGWLNEETPGTTTVEDYFTCLLYTSDAADE